jgi:hypothetical protein
MGNYLSAQDNRRFGRTLVCGALLVYGCLRIPAAAQPTQPYTPAVHDLQEVVRKVEAQQQQILDRPEELKPPSHF